MLHDSEHGAMIGTSYIRSARGQKPSMQSPLGAVRIALDTRAYAIFVHTVVVSHTAKSTILSLSSKSSPIPPTTLTQALNLTFGVTVFGTSYLKD